MRLKRDAAARAGSVAKASAAVTSAPCASNWSKTLDEPATCRATIIGIWLPASEYVQLVISAASDSTPASHAAGLFVRATIQAPAPEPKATPVITAANAAANAYVVGPRTSDRM